METRRGHASRTLVSSCAGQRVACAPGLEERWIGRVLEGRYRLDEPLGEGGMAWVFRAFHLGLQQPIAVKLLRPELRADPLVVDRFLAEAQLTARLGGPHVVRVLDTGSVGAPRCPFIVMELLHGRDLEQVLADSGRLPVEQAVELLIQACSALAEAHAIGIIHRDIKPANLFWTELADGMSFLKVLDFGVCKHRARRDQRTFPGGCVGSPHYMAPEQIVEASRVDERADVWALGVVLFEMLSGRVPFAGSTPQEVCATVLRDEVISLRDAGGVVPWSLSRVVERCLRKEPDERYRSVRELAEALQDALQYEGASAAQGVARIPRADQVTTGPRPLTTPLPKAVIPAGAAALPPSVASEAASVLGVRHPSWLGTSPTEPGGSGPMAAARAVRVRLWGKAPLRSARALVALTAVAAGLTGLVTSITQLSGTQRPLQNVAIADVNAVESAASSSASAPPEAARSEPAAVHLGRAPVEHADARLFHRERVAERTAPQASQVAPDSPPARTASVSTNSHARASSSDEGARPAQRERLRGGAPTHRAAVPSHEDPPEELDQLLLPWEGP